MIRIDNENQKEDQIRRIDLGSPFNMLLYPVGIFVTDTIGYETTDSCLLILHQLTLNYLCIESSSLIHNHTQKRRTVTVNDHISYYKLFCLRCLIQD